MLATPLRCRPPRPTPRSTSGCVPTRSTGAHMRQRESAQASWISAGSAGLAFGSPFFLEDEQASLGGRASYCSRCAARQRVTVHHSCRFEQRQLRRLHLSAPRGHGGKRLPRGVAVRQRPSNGADCLWLRGRAPRSAALWVWSLRRAGRRGARPRPHRHPRCRCQTTTPLTHQLTRSPCPPGSVATPAGGDRILVTSGRASAAGRWHARPQPARTSAGSSPHRGRSGRRFVCHRAPRGRCAGVVSDDGGAREWPPLPAEGGRAVPLLASVCIDAHTAAPSRNPAASPRRGFVRRGRHSRTWHARPRTIRSQRTPLRRLLPPSGNRLGSPAGPAPGPAGSRWPADGS